VVLCKEVRSAVRESGESFERVAARAQQQTKSRPQQQQTLSQSQIKTIPRLLRKNLSTHNQKPEVKREKDGAQTEGRRRY
jgi:hypothetical protein